MAQDLDLFKSAPDANEYNSEITKILLID